MSVLFHVRPVSCPSCFTSVPFHVRPVSCPSCFTSVLFHVRPDARICLVDQAVLDGKWVLSDSRNIHWKRLRNVVFAVARFRRGLVPSRNSSAMFNPSGRFYIEFLTLNLKENSFELTFLAIFIRYQIAVFILHDLKKIQRIIYEFYRCCLDQKINIFSIRQVAVKMEAKNRLIGRKSSCSNWAV